MMMSAIHNKSQIDFNISILLLYIHLHVTHVNQLPMEIWSGTVSKYRGIICACMYNYNGNIIPYVSLALSL